MPRRDSFQKAVVRGLDGAPKELAVVSRTDDVVYLCSIERFRSTDPENLEDFVVGFPIDDVSFKNVEASDAA